MDEGADRAMSGSPASRIRVCLVVGQLAVGGLERQVYFLASTLRRDGLDVLVVSLNGAGFWSGPLKEAGVRVAHLERHGRRDWRRLIALTRLLRREQPDVVYSFNYENNAYARLAGWLARVPILITGERGVSMSRWQGFLERILVRITECVICNADAIRQDLIQRVGLPGWKILVVPNAIEVPRLSPEARRLARSKVGVEGDEILIGTVARLDPVKNLQMMLDAAAICGARRPVLRFCIVGSGPEEPVLRAAVGAARLESTFLMIGEVTPATDILVGFDLFLLTSHTEGLPNAVMEAMAAAIPCLCTDVGGCRELVVQGVTGFLVAPGDARALADRILDLAGDPVRRAAMGRAGRSRIGEDRTPDDLGRRMEAILRRLMSARLHRRRGQRWMAADKTVDGGERHAPHSL